MVTKDKLDENYEYLKKVVYEAVHHSATGKLLINTFYCRKVAKMLGGDYDSLTKVQKHILKSDITVERICLEDGIEKYYKF